MVGAAQGALDVRTLADELAAHADTAREQD
jgi:hypothetical protein